MRNQASAGRSRARLHSQGEARGVLAGQAKRAWQAGRTERPIRAEEATPHSPLGSLRSHGGLFSAVKAAGRLKDWGVSSRGPGL